MNLTRRKLITGLATLIAAPTIVRASSIMHVRPLAEDGALKSIEMQIIRVWIGDRVVWEARASNILPISADPTDGEICFLQAGRCLINPK